MVDLCLGDDDPVCVGEGCEQVDGPAVVLDRTSQALAVDRDRPQRRRRRIVVVGILFAWVLLGHLGRCLDPSPPGIELANEAFVDGRLLVLSHGRLPGCDVAPSSGHGDDEQTGAEPS